MAAGAVLESAEWCGKLQQPMARRVDVTLRSEVITKSAIALLCATVGQAGGKRSLL